MQIHQIHIQNFRRFQDLTLDFHDQMNVLIGNNGVGKTSILDAITVALGSIFLGIDDLASPGFKPRDSRQITTKIGSTIDRQAQYPVSVSCTGEFGGISMTWERTQSKAGAVTSVGGAQSIKQLAMGWQQCIASGMTNVDLPLVAYYGTGRLWMPKKDSASKQIDNRFHGYMGCLSADSNEKQMITWFENMTYAELQDGVTIPELQAVRSAIVESYLESGTHVQDANVRFNVKEHQLEITYQDEAGNLHRHPFHELSDGYRNTLSMIADIAYRMAVLNPQYLGDVTKKTSGVVLIDEIDLHLHPKWQKSILKTLLTVFPKVQFIVTTHSPSIISTAKAEQLLILDENGVSSFGENVYGKDSNSVLTEIMGTTDRPDDVAQMFREFDHYMEQLELEKAEQKLDALRKVLGNADQGVVNAAVALDFQKEWDDGGAD